MLVAPKTITLRRPATADASITAQVDPEGRQSQAREMKRVYSRSELRTADPDTPLRADQLIIGGKTYDVLDVEDFSDDPHLPHYEALVEQTETELVSVKTPTATATMNYTTGAASRTIATDSTEGWLRSVRFSEVSQSGGAYQLGDVVLRVKRDELTTPPTTSTTFTHGGLDYEVFAVELNERTQKWLLSARRMS